MVHALRNCLFTTCTIMDKVNICSLNVRGLGNRKKRLSVFTWLKKSNFNIIFLQETHSSKLTENLWSKEWNDKIYFSHGTSASTGVCILFNKLPSVQIIKQNHDTHGRLLACQIKLGDDEMTLCNVYGPNNDNPGFFDNCADFLKDFNAFYIIGGDFNTVINPVLDKRGGRELTHVRARISIHNLIDQFNLIDIWRSQHLNIKNFTWSSSSEQPILCRLDYFLISNSLSGRIDSSDISHGFRSDHSLVSFSINPQVSRGPGFWKLNTSLLQDEKYIDMVKNVIDKTKQDCRSNNPNTIWEMIKLNVRGSTIKYASMKKKNTDSNIKTLTKEINDLDVKCKDNPNDELLKTELKSKEKLLEDIFEEKSHGIYIRSKAQWVEDGEKCSKYFLNLEKNHSERKIVQKLIVDDKEILNSDDILAAEAKFYQNLYSASNSEDDSLDLEFLSPSIPKLTEDKSMLCEGYISCQECWNAVQSMPNNKSPGTDGFPCEFYKTFWPSIHQPLCNSINYSFEIGALSVSQKRGIITLLPKKGKPTVYLKNWRPISLLNVDYKIITKVLANRMKKVLVDIIHHDQTGFLKGRYIGENIRLLLDIINFTNVNDIPGFAFAIDFEKAFDKISWSCINKALSLFGFGPDFQKWVNVIYNGAQSCVTNNGYASEFFDISRGVRQGCCLSPYIFLICCELLSHAIRSADKIKGITVPLLVNNVTIDYEVKISQYADDTVVYMDGSENCLEETLDILDKFAIFSGLQINYEKSTVFRLGSLKTSNVEFAVNRNLKWSSESIMYLGMLISHNESEMLDFNFNTKLSEIKSSLKMWKGRNLTLVGKITLVKTFALSKLVYPFSVLASPPESFFKDLDQILFDFIWDGKPDKIKRKTLILPIAEGGLGMPDCRIFCKVMKIVWIKRFYDKSEDVRWKILFSEALKSHGGMLLFRCNFDEGEPFIHKIRNKFIKDVVKSWALLHYKVPENPHEVRNQVLWYNSEIKIGKKIVFWKKWQCSGIVYINDIITDTSGPKFMSIGEINNKFNMSLNWFEYHQLVSAIPVKWKNMLSTDGNMQQFNDHAFVILCKCNRNRIVRDKLLENISIPPSRIIRKWENSTPNYEFDWGDIFSLAFRSVIDSKTRNFQFKLLHRIIATNDFLYKLDIIDDDSCTFCEVETETLEHVFYYCHLIKDFWKRVTEWIKLKINCDLCVSKTNILFGYDIKNPASAINSIILLGKQFIYKCKIYKITPKFPVFVHNIKEFIKIEYLIALRKNKLALHYSKWDGFMP